MNYAILVAVLMLLPACAEADAIVETTGTVSQSVNSAFNNAFSEVDLPAFNTALGTLTGVSIDINAGVTGTVTEYGAPPEPPQMVAAKVGLSFLSPTSIAFPGQTMQVYEAGNSASAFAFFSGTFSPSSLASFLAVDDNFFVPEPDVFIQALAGPDTEEVISITFDITETLTYTPVPEPASLAMLATGLIALTGCALRLRTDAHSFYFSPGRRLAAALRAVVKDARLGVLQR